MRARGNGAPGGASQSLWARRFGRPDPRGAFRRAIAAIYRRRAALSPQGAQARASAGSLVRQPAPDHIDSFWRLTSEAIEAMAIAIDSGREVRETSRAGAAPAEEGISPSAGHGRRFASPRGDAPHLPSIPPATPREAPPYGWGAGYLVFIPRKVKSKNVAGEQSETQAACWDMYVSQ